MAKELIKENVIEAPTLFVGVGGTGCRIVTRVAEMCRPGEKENINFVCLDTNVNDLSSVAGSGSHIYTVQTSNTQTVGNYLDYDADALNNWFPKNAVLYDKTVSEGAGQVRAISRLALNSTIKTGRIRPLYDAVDDLFRKSGKEMKQAMRAVIVSTASGGTGSGILLPLSMLIRDYVRNKYPNTSLIVRSLLLLPETLDSVITSDIERDSQRRNAYATVKELNAFMMKGSGFFDIDEDLQRYSNLHVDFTNPGSDELKSLSLLPFDFCFLMDGQNAEDSTLVNAKQYEFQAAQALYEQNIGPMQKKAFSVEDNIIKEMSNPGNYGRNRFGGIGAGVIRYPYEEIADYIACGWALDSIGGEGEAAKWAKYDNAFEIKLQDARKKDLSATEMPKREDVYVDKMKTASDNFSKDLRNKFITSAPARIDAYFSALSDHMHDALMQNNAIKNASDAANSLATEIDYQHTEGERGRAVDNLGLLRNYEATMRRNAEKIAENVAEAAFMNEGKTINEKKPYTIESTLKNNFGDICHPNATRYMLYVMKKQFAEKIQTAENRLNNEVLPNLENYTPDADDKSMFDVKFNGKKKERNIDELCAAEKTGDANPNILEKLGGYDKIYEKLNEYFPDYFDTITNYGYLTAELAAYKFGYEYVSDLSKMFERFYRTFGEKVGALVRKQEDLVESLKFRKGDSVLNVCASREILEELARSTRKQSESGSMLEPELNGSIFDAIKANVIFDREIRSADIVEDDRRIDVFDEILLKYFQKAVRRDCESIDMNVIHAIAMENRLKARIKMREEDEAGATMFDNVTPEDNLHYIRKIIAMGERLSAPGIQRITNEEPREIKLCAYNKSLCDMRDYRIDELITKIDTVAADTVSRYDLHFFNALYNLTPDKLNKFASPATTETRDKNAGLYQRAYMSYARHIGPDSTKNIMISTHIDKRWDSISVMPEIDFDFQNRQVMKIHQAMIYGLIYDAIKYVNLSNATSGKRVYKYENSDERMVEMIVSNGTLCDEFYEILDALYISSSIVEDLEIIKSKRRAKDEVRHSNYSATAFARAVKNFTLSKQHEGPASLFEIPLAYYESLPNSQRFEAEITALVEAVVEMLNDELLRWERPSDARFILCNVLKEQFALLMQNYKNPDAKYQRVKAVDNLVISTVFRKIRETLGKTPEPDDYEETLDMLSKLMRE